MSRVTHEPQTHTHTPAYRFVPPIVQRLMPGPYVDWYSKNPMVVPPGGHATYVGLERALKVVTAKLAEGPGFDGVLGFSQGGRCGRLP